VISAAASPNLTIYYEFRSLEVKMTPKIKNILMGSMAVTCIVAIAALVDIFTSVPFAGRTLLDIMFLVSAGLIGYMGFDTWKELS
jgi:hypothetical protein